MKKMNVEEVLKQKEAIFHDCENPGDTMSLEYVLKNFIYFIEDDPETDMYFEKVEEISITSEDIILKLEFTDECYPTQHFCGLKGIKEKVKDFIVEECKNRGVKKVVESSDKFVIQTGNLSLEDAKKALSKLNGEKYSEPKSVTIELPSLESEDEQYISEWIFDPLRNAFESGMSAFMDNRHEEGLWWISRLKYVTDIQRPIWAGFFPCSTDVYEEKVNEFIQKMEYANTTLKQEKK